MKLKELIAAFKDVDHAQHVKGLQNAEVKFDTDAAYGLTLLSVYWDDNEKYIRIDIGEEEDTTIRPDTLNQALNSAAEQYVETVMENITDESPRPRHWRIARDLIKSADLDLGFKKILLDYMNSIENIDLK